MTDEPREPRGIERRTVRVKPHSYQPSKAELEEDVKLETTPEKLATSLLRPVKVVEVPDA